MPGQPQLEPYPESAHLPASVLQGASSGTQCVCVSLIGLLNQKPDVRVPLIGGALDTGPVWKQSREEFPLCTL